MPYLFCGGKDVLAAFYVSTCLFRFFWNCFDLSLPAAVTRFICVKCTQTWQLSSHCLFLNRVSVRRHIAASKPCKDSKLGFREFHVQARAADAMAGDC